MNRTIWQILGALLGLTLCSPLAAQEAFLQPLDWILWAGDSITARNLYPGYVMRVLKTRYPNGGLTDVNCGVGGATSPSLLGDMRQKVPKNRPTIITAMFGVNDTGWSSGDEPKKIATYTAGLQVFADLAKQNNARLLLLRETHF